MGDRRGQPHPAALDEGLVGLGESRRGDHTVPFQPRSGPVARHVQRRQRSFGHLTGRLQYGIDQIGIEVRVDPGGLKLFQTEDMLQREAKITNGGAVAHTDSLDRGG